MSTDIVVTIPKLTVAAETAFTVTRLREYVTSGLSDSALQGLLDAAFLAIDNAIGPRANLTESLDAGPGDFLMLSRRAASIVSVVEDQRWLNVTLDTTDYELSASGQVLRRLTGGNHPGLWSFGKWTRWWGRVVVTYTPVDDTADRNRVAVELVQLDLAFSPGTDSETIGTWTEKTSSKPYQQQRAEILGSLSNGMDVMLI